MKVVVTDIESFYYCRNDYLVIRDGAHYGTPLLALVCGHPSNQSNLPVYYSNTDESLVSFLSDDQDQFVGFAIEIRSLNGKLITHLAKISCFMKIRTPSDMAVGKLSMYKTSVIHRCLQVAYIIFHM